MKRRKLLLFIASTLDGYIATEDHNLDWLFQVEGEGDNGISDFYAQIDTILMGRTTYDWLMKHNEIFPYQDKECYVFSRSIEGPNEQVTFVNEDVTSFTNKLKEQEGKAIWVMGGSGLLSHFFKEKLLDEIIVTLAPVLLGKGIPLFRGILEETKLNLLSIQRFNQFVELHYEVID